MILFKNKKKSVKLDPVIYWNNCDIPAKLFFEIWDSGDHSSLGTDTPEKLDDAYSMIFDEYVELDGSSQIMAWYKKTLQIQDLQVKISTINTCLHHIAFSVMDKEELIEAVRVINLIKGCNVRFDLKKDTIKEIIRVQTSVIGSLENRINQLTDVSTEKKEKVKYHFEQDLVSIENVLERNTTEDISLRKFVFLKKSAIDKANRLSKINQKHGS